MGEEKKTGHGERVGTREMFHAYTKGAQGNYDGTLQGEKIEPSAPPTAILKFPFRNNQKVTTSFISQFFRNIFFSLSNQLQKSFVCFVCARAIIRKLVQGHQRVSTVNSLNWRLLEKPQTSDWTTKWRLLTTAAGGQISFACLLINSRDCGRSSDLCKRRKDPPHADPQPPGFPATLSRQAALQRQKGAKGCRGPLMNRGSPVLGNRWCYNQQESLVEATLQFSQEQQRPPEIFLATLKKCPSRSSEKQDSRGVANVRLHYCQA
ncbi:uncharacterized protein LOC121715680 [Alosa sapidissima]|uniref:uncharacterized protein LOC121715680 n=1 Tax=Alosa sapidissima TaxID=34773 RepID=UPI001C0851BD|nr:uncharacterized protein LOC121715680 [Alosa sapidissima]